MVSHSAEFSGCSRVSTAFAISSRFAGATEFDSKMAASRLRVVLANAWRELTIRARRPTLASASRRAVPRGKLASARRQVFSCRLRTPDVLLRVHAHLFQKED